MTSPLRGVRGSSMGGVVVTAIGFRVVKIVGELAAVLLSLTIPANDSSVYMGQGAK